MFVLFAALVSVVWQIARVNFKTKKRSNVALYRNRAAVHAGVQRILPMTLLLTFLLVPSTATMVFKTFLCDHFSYDDTGTVRRYLHDDLALSCDSIEYESTKNVALLMILLWPIGALHGPLRWPCTLVSKRACLCVCVCMAGVPLLYACLLWVSRKALVTGRSTPMSRAIGFVAKDYGAAGFWWELCEPRMDLNSGGEGYPLLATS